MRKVNILDTAKQFFKRKPAEYTENSVGSQRSVREVAQQLGKVIDTRKRAKDITYCEFNDYLAYNQPLSSAFSQILQDMNSFGTVIKSQQDDVKESKVANIVQDILNVKFVGAEYCTERGRIFEHIMRGIYYGEVYVKITYNTAKPQESFIDVIPNNQVQVSMSIDNYIRTITVSKEQGKGAVYYRNTPLDTAPDYFFLQVKGNDGVVSFNGIDNDYKEFIFHFPKYSMPSRTSMTKAIYSKILPIKPLLDSYSILEDKYLNQINKSNAVDNIIAPKNGFMNNDDGSQDKMHQAFNSKSPHSTFISSNALEVTYLQQSTIAIEYRKEMIELGKQIQLALGIPLSRLDSGATQYANQLQDNKRYLIGVVKALADEVCGILTKVMRYTIEDFQKENLIIESDPEQHLMYCEIQAAVYTQLFKDKVITHDEVRNQIGYSPLTEEEKQKEAMLQSTQELNKMFQ
jgi:hypothetical protein